MSKVVTGVVTVDKFGVTVTVNSPKDYGKAALAYEYRAKLIEEALDLLREERNMCLYMTSLALNEHDPDRYQDLEDAIMGADDYLEVDHFFAGECPPDCFATFEYLYSR